MKKEQTLREAILEFCVARSHASVPRFEMRELRDHVENRLGKTAPESAGRVFRALAKEDEIAYEQIDRARSTYLLTRIRSIKFARTAPEPVVQFKRWGKALSQFLDRAYDEGLVPDDAVLELRTFLKGKSK